MIRAFAPRNPRGYSWVLLSIAVLIAWAGAAEAQTPKNARTKGKAESSQTKDDSVKDEDAPKEKAKEEAPKEGADAGAAEAPKKEPSIEVFKDPRAEAILKKSFKVAGKMPKFADKKQVLNMVAGVEHIDRPAIDRFVDGCCYLLTNPVNVAALAAGEGGKKPLDIKTGTDDLLEVLHKAQQAKNADFLTQYNRALLSKLTPLLGNNLFARIEAMIVLAQTGSPDMVSTFVKQLSDTNQTVWVKIWAARGITSATGGATRDLPTKAADDAGKALAGWLTREEDLPWFAQLRALEAIGSLRQAKSAARSEQPDLANLAMRYLADQEARPEVRAMAGWAIGMMRIDGALGKFNFGLVGYNIADVAAVLGEKIAEVFDDNPQQASYYTGILLYQIHFALDGDPNIRDSGILKVPGNLSGHAQAKAFLQQVDAQVKTVTANSVELIRAPGGKQKALQQQVGDRVAALRSFLGKNQPADKRLMPGGPEFSLEDKKEVARAREEK